MRALAFLQQRSLAATATQIANAVLLELFGKGFRCADGQRLLARLGVTPRGPWRVLRVELHSPVAADDRKR